MENSSDSSTFQPGQKNEQAITKKNEKQLQKSEKELKKIKDSFSNFQVKRVFIAERPLQGDKSYLNHHGLVCVGKQEQQIIVEKYINQGFSVSTFDEGQFKEAHSPHTFDVQIQFHDILDKAHILSLREYNLITNNCQDFTSELYKQLTGKDAPMDQVQQITEVAESIFKHAAGSVSKSIK